MGLHTLFLAGLIPAALLVLGGRGIDARVQSESLRRRYRLILGLAAALVSLGAIGIAAWLTPAGDNRPLVPVAPFLAPALLAALALVVLNLPGLSGARPLWLGILLALALGVAILLLVLNGEPTGNVTVALTCALVLVAAWLLGRASDALAAALGLVALLLLVWMNRLIASDPSADYSTWLQLFWLVMLYSLPGITVALAAVLVLSGMKQLSSENEDRPGPASPSWRRAIPRFMLAGALVAAVAYTILWASIWDQTNDGLAGIWFTTQSILVAIGAGVLMTFALQGRQARAAAVFLLGVPLVLILAFSTGWRSSHLEITAGRAARIQRAAERFYAREEKYPGTLAELTPRDALWIPGPVILQGEGWCYQGGADYYRLGAFYRDFFSLPLSLKVYAQAGEPPQTGWECAERLPGMKARYDLPGFPPQEQP